MKKEIVLFLSKQTKEFVEESEKMRQPFLDDRCAQYATMLKNLIDTEFSELDKKLTKKVEDLKKVTDDLSTENKGVLELEISNYNKK